MPQKNMKLAVTMQTKAAFLKPSRYFCSTNGWFDGGRRDCTVKIVTGSKPMYRKATTRIIHAKPISSNNFVIMMGTTVPPIPAPLSMTPYAVARRLKNQEAAVDMQAMKMAPPLTPTQMDCARKKCQYCVPRDTIIKPNTYNGEATRSSGRGPYLSHRTPNTMLEKFRDHDCTDIIHWKFRESSQLRIGSQQHCTARVGAGFRSKPILKEKFSRSRSSEIQS